MVTVPIRNDNAYFGIAKQSSQGTPVAPSMFFRWLDGSKLEYDMAAVEIWEGDGSRHLSQLTKERQSVKVSIVLNPRPIELGLLETAALGAGADTLTAATTNTTLSSAVTAGATTFQLTANTGLTSVGTAILVLSPGQLTEEIVSVTTPGTGTGPYTYTVANSGTVKNAHASGDAARSSSSHLVTDQIDGNYYTIEVGLGSLNGGAGITIRITDCKAEQLKRAAKSGGYLEYSIDFTGIASVVQGTPSTVSFEAHNSFLYTQSNGGWTLNGSTTGDATAVQDFSITTKNALDGVQTESLTYAAIIFGNLMIDVSLSLVYQNNNLIAQTYFGSISGTTDSQSIGSGTLQIVFTQADGFHTVTFNVPTMHYSKTTMPAPKKDGKSYTVGLATTGVSNQSANANLLKVTVTNTQNTAY